MTDIAPTLEILERLIAFDTTSRNSNLELIDWVEGFLKARGIESTRVGNAEGTKANLYAVIGPRVEGGIVLSGHTDVVPVDGQPWTSDPWKVTAKGDGKLYGRGVADMKAFSALALAHIDHALAAGIKRPLILALSYDEEIGCLGAPSMINEIARIMPKPEAAIIGEPTSMKVISAHKSIRTYIVEVIGREAHSSLPQQGVSAVMEALKLMNLIAEMGREPPQGAGTLFSPPGHTMTIGRVDGGTAVNILARRCEFIFDLRCPTAAEANALEKRFFEAAATLDAEIKARVPEGGVTVTRRSSTPGLELERSSSAEVLARAITGDNDTRAASYAAEAGLFQNAGIPSVLCGPGSIEQAHQPDEWIEISQIEEGARFFEKLIARLSA